MGGLRHKHDLDACNYRDACEGWLGRESVAGDMDLNPETGQYRLSASVPVVEVNDLRRTLAMRPMPFPLGGALRGVLHCTGPLETPVFSGARMQGSHHQAMHPCPQQSSRVMPLWAFCTLYL